MNKAILILFFSISLHSYCQNLEKGNLVEFKKANLVEELQNLTGKKIDSSQIIIINFFDKPAEKPNGSCIDYYTSDNKYKRFFKKKSIISQFFITQQGYEYNKRKVVEDKNNIIRSLIFTDAQSCGNYMIIKSNGDYLKKLGEYRQDEMLKMIKAL